MKKKTEMPDLSYVGTQRYVCDVLEEMRMSIKMLNFAGMSSLIEEVQILVNRMEAALRCKRDIKLLYEDLGKLKDARKALKIEVEALIKKRDS